MADVNISDSDWSNLSADDQNNLMSMVSNTFGYNVVPSGSGIALASAQSNAPQPSDPVGATPCAQNCDSVRQSAMYLCDQAQEPAYHDACVGVAWAAYGTCMLFC